MGIKEALCTKLFHTQFITMGYEQTSGKLLHQVSHSESVIERYYNNHLGSAHSFYPYYSCYQYFRPVANII